MDSALEILIITAFSLGFFHTLVGVDHYLPFVVLGRSQGWKMKKIMLVTALCGIGHVASSVILGAVGIGLGTAISSLEWVEGIRGSMAAWLLIGFGITYAAWATIRLLRGKTHTHSHQHPDGTVHDHEHNHHDEHLHPHQNKRNALTAWSLFIIFALGPCEPLIPILMAPAFDHGWWATGIVALAFGVATLGTMLTMVFVGSYSLRFKIFRSVERYANVLAGLAIASSGLAIQFLGI